MKNRFLKGLIASFALAVSGFANAGLITVSQMEEITAEGQSFTFDFDMLPSQITDLQFYINVYGDYTDGQNEYVQVIFQDFLGLIQLSPNGQDTNTIDGFSLSSFNYSTIACCVVHDMFASFSVSGSSMSFLTSNQFSLSLNNSADVRDNTAFNADEIDFVEVGFTFNTVEVPEPSTLAVFALGLMGLASRKLKKQA